MKVTSPGKARKQACDDGAESDGEQGSMDLHVRCMSTDSFATTDSESSGKLDYKFDAQVHNVCEGRVSSLSGRWG